MIVSIVLPCFNPPVDWEKNIVSRYGELQVRIPDQLQLIIVLDGAGQQITEQQKQYLKSTIPGIIIIEYEINRGKGYATRQGVMAAAGDLILYTDIDFPYEIKSICEVYHTLKGGEADIAAGIKGEDYYSHVPFLRRLISRYLRALTRFFLSLPVTDTQCGLKGFTREASGLFLSTTIERYLFDLEFLRNAYRSRKFRIKPVVVHLNENIHFRKMNYSILFPEIRNFIRILLFSKRPQVPPTRL